MSPLPSRRARGLRVGLGLVAALLLAPLALASDPGFVAHFSNGDKLHFGSSQSTVQVQPTGGVAGVGDGWLLIDLDFPANLGAQTSLAELTGDHLASGATGVAFWLRDVGADDNLQIRVGVGVTTGTVYLSNQGFNPPSDQWQRYEVDFTDPSQWTRIKGSGSLASALASSNRLLFRHDVPPLTSMPNDKVGDFGIDRVALLPCAYEVGAVDAGGANTLVLDTFDDTTLGTTHTWVGQGGPSGATGFVLLSLFDVELPLFGGTLLVDPDLSLLVPVTADAAGEVVLPLAVPSDPALAGGTVHGQIALRDAGAPVGWRFTNRLTATLCE